MKIISTAKHEKLLRAKVERDEYLKIINNYHTQFQNLCNEYNIEIDYEYNNPSHNFSMIRKRYLELFTRRVPFLLKELKTDIK